MKVLFNEWKGGFVPYHTNPGQVRIEVALWLRLFPVQDMFIIPDKDVRRVLAYVRRSGVRQTLRKVVSRLGENHRNEKYVAWGIGWIAEGTSGDRALVMFVAPSHPRCVEEISLDRALVRPLPASLSNLAVDRCIREGECSVPQEIIQNIAGWSPLSGRPMDPRTLDQVMAFASASAEGLETKSWRPCDRQPAVSGSGATLTARVQRLLEPSRPVVPEGCVRKTAVLFGYGHYAKNVVLPRVGHALDVTCIHEIDPVQLGQASRHIARLSTAATLEEGEDGYDCFLIASYHHTHAQLAIKALELGAAAVVEKPLATTHQQLSDLREVMRTSDGRLYLCFQRRYSRFNEFIREDLQLKPEDAVSCRAVVFEIPLPRNHWYKWPNSGSRVVSNGCHWIDYFLFLNSFSRPERTEARILANGDYVVLMDLANGASLSLTITEEGSPRLGVRDHVELTHGGRRAVIEDEHIYEAESPSRVLRSCRTGKMDSYDRMYTTIAENILLGKPGDAFHSVEVSTLATLDAEEAARAGRVQGGGSLPRSL